MSWLIDKNTWLAIYNSIKNRLNLSFQLDQLATNILSEILTTLPNTIDLQQLKSAINGNCVIVLGPALNIDHDFEKAKELNLLDKCSLISVDGTSSFLYEKNFVPDVIVTDLDGNPNHIAYLNKKNSIVVVHGHGDNINDIFLWVPKFEGPVIGSTQVEPRPFVYNFGGFTDGDRALFIAYALSVREIIVGGMDFKGVIGKYSILYRKKDEIVKKMKMSIALELIIMLINKGMNIKTLSDTGIPGAKII